MKRGLLITLFLLSVEIVYSQAYRSINIVEPDYIKVSSKEGISVSSVTPNDDKSYKVVLYNNNNPNPGEITTYNFEWYLSYKGNRVSDYYYESIQCHFSSERTVYCWPGEVPVGNEKFVTVQLGREPIKRDPRDDD